MAPPLKRSLLLLILVSGLAALTFWAVATKPNQPPMHPLSPAAQRPDFSSFSAAAPGKPLHLLFIHHSCGGQLFAAQGTDAGQNAVYQTHPNGGNLRARLEDTGYVVHEASYGSRVGEKTDVFDWLPKFRTQMDEILACAHQDERHSGGQRNQVVVFKSCFPNNAFTGEGRAPGDPAGPQLTLWNVRATYAALLPEFQKHPDVLFVCMTAPPVAPANVPNPAWKRLAKQLLGRHSNPEDGARVARKLANWLASEDGWLAGYRAKNVVVFDYYDILTGEGASNCSVFPTGGGYDGHPSTAGNNKAADAFLPFLNRVVRRIGLTP